MIETLMRIVSRTLDSSDAIIGVGGGAYAIRGDGQVVLAWSRTAARSLLTDGLPSDAITIDVDPSTHIPSDMTRSASITEDVVADLSKVFSGKVVQLRLAQFGGHGGMPAGMGQGIGGSPGSTNPMAAPGQFTNYIARQQFDRSLDQARKGPEFSGWNKSLETRLAENDLYGHTRTERDRDMEPYEKSWEDRVKLKKSRYMQRVREIRKERTEPKKPDPNSVAAIKAILPNPNDHASVENRLGEYREVDGEQFRPGYHGPESQFTYFPRPVAAENTLGRTVEARSPVGYTAFDEIDGPFAADPYQHDSAGGDGDDRYHQMPYGMQGYKRENPNDIGELWKHYRNGRPGDYNIDLLMNHWPHGTQPGQDPSVFTAGDKQRIIELMRQRFYADDQPEGRGTAQGKTLEQKLRSKHRSTPLGSQQPTAADQNADPYPYSKDVPISRVRQPR